MGNLRWKAHLLAEVVQMEQRLQVCALPLSCHVEVGQLRLEGPLGKGKGCQLRELGPSCLPSLGCRCQLGRLLAQLQASAVLGLSGEGRVVGGFVLLWAGDSCTPVEVVWGSDQNAVGINGDE